MFRELYHPQKRARSYEVSVSGTNFLWDTRISSQSQRFTRSKPGLYIFWLNSWRNGHQWCCIHLTGLCLRCREHLQGQHSGPPGLFYLLHYCTDCGLGGPSCTLTCYISSTIRSSKYYSTPQVDKESSYTPPRHRKRMLWRRSGNRNRKGMQKVLPASAMLRTVKGLLRGKS